MHSFNTFLKQSLRHYIKVGNLFPSSKRLAKRMVRGVNETIVVELGPGTGVVTREILKNLPSNGKLICIEENENFSKYLGNTIEDKRLIIHTGQAKFLEDFLKKHNIKRVNTIISGVPLGNLNKEEKNKTLGAIHNCLEADGHFIQFEYLLAGMKAVKSFFPYISLSFEFFNVPPAFVMKCKKSK